ncbi:integrase family protein [Candidatus Magnetobacterium bavaricum]|uniref:Integrase family protein n=1 Tax=Candidatus Magnetobacterium bavaricum TaxID=29290 RepID=A0A0F3GPL9_9BACT|nr:integrase family protein [Candidatus Magnetobacterium bavaricum]
MNKCYSKGMGRKRTKMETKKLPSHLHLKSGYYYYVIYINGKTKWYPLKTQNEAEALKRWAEVESRLKQETGLDITSIGNDTQNKITFKSLCERFFNDATTGLASKTIQNYKRMSEELCKIFGNTQVQKISRQDIIRYHDSMRDKPYEANRRIGFIRMLFQKALDWGYVQTNVADGIKKFKEHRHHLELTTEILFGNLYTVADDMLKRAIMLAFHLVQHENEIKRLQWKDFDFQNNTVKFQRQKTKEEIVINYSQNTTLTAYMKYLQSQRKELSQYVICHQSKQGLIQYQSFRKMWTKVLKQAGFEKGQYLFKEIRHLANTCMKDAGIIADKRMAMTGHKSTSANEIYTHTTGTDTIEASKALGIYHPDKF